MCSERYRNGYRAECTRLRGWAFGDGRAIRRVMVIDRNGEHITRTYSVDAVAGPFGAQEAAILRFMEDNSLVGQDFKRFNARSL